ncbi:restriction of telomere capping protein 1 [Scheffersomyces amazonensis]|uniref:restriction of telomere capping protein 1 n=1 Tax=Scheffersomyces amazonensis TaxID=1078765 RepID=UPI00315D2CCF
MISCSFFSTTNPNSNHSSLAKFAFNIYGTLNHSNSNSYESSTSPASSFSSNRSNSKIPETFDYRSNKLIYNCEREVITLSQLNYPLNNLSNTFPSDHAISHHVIVGGRNYLRLLALNEDQSRIIQDINILEPNTSQYSSRVTSGNKLNNINTIKSHHDIIASGLSNGLINVFKISPNGKSRLINKFSDHKRCINSLDFITSGSPYEPSNLLISGSQDGSIKLWDLRSSTPRPVVTIMSSSHSDPIRSCQYSPHSSSRNRITILSVHDSGSLCKFDVRSGGGQNVFTPERKWNLHTGPALSLHIHPEKQYVLTGGRDQKLCIWNYSDSNPSSNRVTPEHIINTYGPVMKVRWSQYPSLKVNDGMYENSQQLDDKLTYEEREAFYSTSNSNSNSNANSNHLGGNPLYNYDFACSYLNDDPTITVYNLNRKYIPKEVITSATTKPFQNFIWPTTSTPSRKLWTVTKSNVFTTYDLDNQDGSADHEISRPLDELSTSTLTWNNGIGDFCFVNQDKYEYEMTDNESSYTSENDELDELSTNHIDRSNNNSVVEEDDYNSYEDIEIKLGSLPTPIINSGSNSVTSSSFEKPGLFRSNTHYSINFTKSPSPVPRSGTFNSLQDPPSSITRPKLQRNASTNTQDSNLSFGSTVHSNMTPTRKGKRISYGSTSTYLSPFIVPISLPIPSNDSSVFNALANNYLISIPEGFNLIDVCLLNASIAATVRRLRECQVWRMLAVALEEEHIYSPSIEGNEEGALINEQTPDEQYNNKDNKSISSDLGNFVGSYNSNSTQTTNYGGHSGKSQSVESLNLNKQSQEKIPIRSGSISSKPSLTNLLNKSRGNSFSNILGISPDIASSFLRKDSDIGDEDKTESAVVDDDEPSTVSASLQGSKVPSLINLNKSEHSAPISIQPQSQPKDSNSNSNSNSRSSHKYSFTSQRRPTFTSSEDLDNENLNILNNAANNNSSPTSNVAFLQSGGSPNYFNQMHHHSHASFSSRRSSIIQSYGFGRMRPSPGSGTQIMRDEFSSKSVLNEVEEEVLSEKNTVKSELTRALEAKGKGTATATGTEDTNTLFKAWKLKNLLKEALDYSSQQGDIVFCSTVALLFHEQFSDIISEDIALDWISLYIEILQRKKLDVISANVINCTPRNLRSKIKELTIKDVDLRFYCCWCEKLLVNEQSKMKFQKNNNKEEFGYWYCDECCKKQSNCIYCHEPCKGLTIVVSLKCGHRGHFGCLKEWFVEEENIICPGGCDYNIL